MREDEEKITGVPGCCSGGFAVDFAAWSPGTTPLHMPTRIANRKFAVVPARTLLRRGVATHNAQTLNSGLALNTVQRSENGQ